MDTVDDIDEDEAFINELMALHPNDEDIVVEDMEALDYGRTTANDDVEVNNNENNDDGVRKKIVFWVYFSYRLIIFRKQLLAIKLWLDSQKFLTLLFRLSFFIYFFLTPVKTSKKTPVARWI